jgi:hypothetical protein
MKKKLRYPLEAKELRESREPHLLKPAGLFKFLAEGALRIPEQEMVIQCQPGIEHH